MINGIVVGLQARINVALYDFAGNISEIECVVDTGFEGFLTLPIDLVEALELPYIAPIDARLADHSAVSTSVHRGIIAWNGSQRVIPVLAMGRRPLLGTVLLEDSHLSIDFCEGGSVIIDEMI